MPFTPQDITATIGTVLFSAGVYLQFGAGWACIAAGSLLIGLTIMSVNKG